MTYPCKMILLSFLLLPLCIHATSLKQLPEATLVNFHNSETITTEQLKGKVVYLDFWASWCKPCKKSFPFMNQLKQRYPSDKFQIIAINMDESKQDAIRFLDKMPAQFGIFQNPNNTLASELKLPGLPVAYIIDKNGEIVAKHTGFNDSKKKKKLKQLDYLMEQP